MKKTWGKEIWEEKAKKQKPKTVVGGSLATKKGLIKEAQNKLLFLEKEVLPLIKKHGKIADVGIGPMARFAIEFAKRNYNIIGIDVSPTTIKLAKSAINKARIAKKIKLVVADMTQISLKEKVDLIFCYATFYHIPSYLSLEVLKRFNMILKKEGYAFIEFGLKRTFSLKNYIFGLLWFIGHSYKKIKGEGFRTTITKFTKEEIEDMVKMAGFKIIKNWGTEYLLKKLK